MALPLVLGYYADRWLGTEPLFILLSLVIGLIAGFRRLLRIKIPTETGPSGDPQRRPSQDSEGSED